MRFTPLTAILLVFVLFFVLGGRGYNNGAYATWGYSGGGILLLILILFLFGVL